MLSIVKPRKRKNSFSRFLPFLLVLPLGFCLGSSIQAAPTVSLTQKGQPSATVVLPPEPAKQERLAAEELVEHLRLISGATLPLADSGQITKGLVPIYLGSAADPKLDAITKAAGDNPSSFTLRVTKDRIDIRGLSDEGTLFGVYELLEQLGVRWYTPGEMGRVVPDLPSAQVRVQQTVQAPSMELRLLQPFTSHTSGWIVRQRLGGKQRSTGAHGIPPFRGGSAAERRSPSIPTAMP